MSTELDLTPPYPSSQPITSPQPGEIWSIHDGAFAMIVREAPSPIPPDAPAAISVMLLSPETQFLSDIDILLSPAQSGLSQDMLAETWHVFSMRRLDLDQFTGVRLTRAIYDCLLDIGDRFHGLTTQPTDAALLGLSAGYPDSHTQPAIQAFHAQARQVSESLTRALDQAQHQYQAIRATERLITEAALQTIELQTTDRPAAFTRLSNWLTTELDHTVSTGWERLNQLYSAPQLATALRGSPSQPDSLTIAQWINQVQDAENTPQHRQAAKYLGERLPTDHPRKSDAIAALIHLLQSTRDNETLWTAVESLWKIDPGNPAAGVKRVKLVDLGMQVAGEPVALAVAIVPQSNQMAVLLQLYPTGSNAYLPENLQLSLIDAAGHDLRQLTARQSDIYIQLKFTGIAGEPFGVKVALGKASLTENFVM